jgi:CDP-glucose 4,6-dehydratase
MHLKTLAKEFSGKSVLVTGHTGFKGSWLTLWLSLAGARVTGVGLAPNHGPDNVFEQARIGDICQSNILDVTDFEALSAVVKSAEPEVVFHLAAQPLVRKSYREPLLTFSTNVMGTANLLEATRSVPSVKAIVCVTTDKVYRNHEWPWPYRETDELGGLDPYSASKAAAELVARSYIATLSAEGRCRVATARGGNVVGGGDWSEDRIVPDIVRALRHGVPLEIRHPKATRPWQHVLELCSGYLRLAIALQDHAAQPTNFSSFNFGPETSSEQPVQALVDRALEAWGSSDHPIKFGEATVHEAGYLKLDSSRARAALGWQPLLSFDETIAWTLEWYRSYCDGSSTARDLMASQIANFSERSLSDFKAP